MGRLIARPRDPSHDAPAHAGCECDARRILLKKKANPGFFGFSGTLRCTQLTFPLRFNPSASRLCPSCKSSANAHGRQEPFNNHGGNVHVRFRIHDGPQIRSPAYRLHHRGLLGRHLDRVVRLLPLRRARRVLRRAFLLAESQSQHRVHRQPVRILDRIPGPALRRRPVRPSGRPDRPQIHLYADPGLDGPGDVPGGLSAGLRHHRRAGAGAAGRLPRRAGPGLGRRIRRCGHIHRRTRARQQARALHQLDPDHGHLRHRAGAAGDPRLPPRHGRRRLQRLWLALSVPLVGGPGHPLRLHPVAAAGIAALRPAQVAGQDLAQSRVKDTYSQRPERGQDADRVVRRHGAGRRGLVHRPVLRAVLSHHRDEDSLRPGLRDVDDRADLRRDRLHLLRLAVGQGRAQVDHDHGLRARGFDLHPGVRDHAGQ